MTSFWLSGGFRLHPLDVVEQYLLVSFGVYLFIHFADDALGIDHKTGALPELHSFPFRLADAEGLHQIGVGIGHQIDGESELRVEVLVRGYVVGAHAKDFDPGGVEFGFGCGERLALDSAAGRVVFWIEVNDKPVSGEIGELRGLAVLVGKRKIRKRVTSGEHGENSFLSYVLQRRGLPGRTRRQETRRAAPLREI